MVIIKGLIALVILIFFYYLMLMMFVSDGFGNQIKLASTYGIIHGFGQTLFLAFVYPKLNHRSFLYQRAIFVGVCIGFVAPYIVWLFNNTFSLVPFWTSYLAAMVLASFLAWILLGVFGFFKRPVKKRKG